MSFLTKVIVSLCFAIVSKTSVIFLYVVLLTILFSLDYINLQNIHICRDIDLDLLVNINNLLLDSNTRSMVHVNI